MNKRRERQHLRMPLEEKVRIAMTDIFTGWPVAVEVHDHDDIQGIVVMVNPSIMAVVNREVASALLTTARAVMHQLAPPDHRYHDWCISIDQGDLHLGRAAHWEQ